MTTSLKSGPSSTRAEGRLPARPNRAEIIPTRDSLLSRIKNHEDHESWADFFNTYWKLVYGVAIRAGLSDGEAQEVVQETVITVARRIPEFKYDPAVCSFKTWLLNLTRWRITDQLRKRRPELNRARSSRDETRGTVLVERIADPAGGNFESVWDAEWQQYVFEAALERVKRRVKPEQYQIFDCLVFKQWPVAKVVRELRMNRAQIYLAKHRVRAVLKKEIRTLERKLA